MEYSSSEVKDIINLYKSGKKQNEIADIYNTYNTTIRRILIRNHVKIRDSSHVRRLCKHNPFKKHDELSDYFLGLLITDGNIEFKKERIRLSLTDTDSYIIERFRDWAVPKGKISRTLQHINSSYMAECSFSNNETVQYLNRLGNFHNKSFCAKLYKPLNYNILRGIIDGDGGMHIIYSSNTHKNISIFICGASKVFMYQIYNFLVNRGFHPTITIRNSLYYVEMFRVSEVIKLGLLLYTKSHIFIKRKYDKWLAFYESRRANTLNSRKGSKPQP